MKKYLLVLVIAFCMCCSVRVNAEDSCLHYPGPYHVCEYQYCDNNYHFKTYTCWYCGQVVTEKEEHDEYSREELPTEKIDANYHSIKTKCNTCKGIISEIKPHVWSTYQDIIKRATPKARGILRYDCIYCSAHKDTYFSWKRDVDYDMYISYDIADHSTVYRNSNFIKVKLDNPISGAILKVKIGSKTYKKKTGSSKNIKVKIKKSPYGKKITIKLYYKGRLIGIDDSDIGNHVRYAKSIKKGMTKNQLKYVWGSPDRTGSSSGGWSYWYYDDGSYVAFRHGKVNNWYNAN